MGKILVLGSKGVLGGQLMKVFGNEAVGWDRRDCDVTDFANLKSKILNFKPLPEVIINCAAYNNVDGSENNQDLAFKLNADVPKNLAEICKELDIIFVHFSTNYIFDGVLGEYNESDVPKPLSVYGKSKYQGEREVQKYLDKYYIIRTAVLFGPKGESGLSKKSFVDIMLDSGEKQSEIKVITDEVNSITYSVDLTTQVKLLLNQGKPYGIYHITNSGFGSWYDLAKEIFNIVGKGINLVPISSADFHRKAKRPKKSVLLNTKLSEFRPWQEALREFLHKD